MEQQEMAKSRKMVTIDGNEAAAYVAHQVSEVCAIYPITPSSNMGEHADAWSAAGRTNIWGTVPLVVEMQSEAGAAGAVHGALQTGALTTTFTASQGLLLMVPNMFKIAGELTSTVFHVSARSVACQALSIFGDHSDVMAVRSTGWALLASNSVQEVMDFALIAHAAALESRVPTVHFFDGFRTSHELNKVEQLAVDDLRAMIDEDLVRAHRDRAMNPERPVLRGTSQNPDVYFQAREAANRYYEAAPAIIQKHMDRFAKLVGRQYRLFDYVGARDAERVIVMMGSGAEVAHETVEYLAKRGEKVGLLKVHLYRPFSVKDFAAALPASAKAVAVLDRTKEPGSAGEPLYLDCVAALAESGRSARVSGGRYGLSSKEFTPAMVKAVFDELARPQPRRHFTVGINDDVTHLSLDVDPSFEIEAEDVVRALFYGLGSDGTVSANHNSIRIIGGETDNYAQGYFVYDSKKAGTVTESHLRFGPRPIRQTCLINRASFVGCHQFVFLEKFDVLGRAQPGATFLLNSPFGPAEVWDRLPREVQEQIIARQLRFYVIDAYQVARDVNLGVRINTIMQTCFFHLSGVLPQSEAVPAIKREIEHAFGKRGKEVIEQNFRAVDAAVANLHLVKPPAAATSRTTRPPAVSSDAPAFVREVLGEIMVRRGEQLPVSKLPVDGTYPTATTRWEKRNIALEIPVWDPAVCIQCAKCSLVCPHGTIRIKCYDPQHLAGAPKAFKSADAKQKQFEGLRCTVQVAPEDCTGCGACVHTCPAKNKTDPSRKAINMADQIPLRETERENYEFFLGLPDFDRAALNVATVKGSQLLRPLFEYSGACAGCGETPYVKLLTQLFGDRAVIANATGCSSIYGGNLPTTPYAVNADGRGPTWNNSLFEDAAEMGYGYRLTLEKHAGFARELVTRLKDQIGAALAEALLGADQSSEAGIAAQRARVAELKRKLAPLTSIDAKALAGVADALVRRSVWIIGGDGWAYDIGYGGLDHVLAGGRNVNVLVLDSEVYSNTGGQMSKSTPRAAVAKFAAGGKPTPKKDLGLIAMSYGSIYVANVAFGANDAQCVKAFVEAESYDGPSLIIAYAHCIAHGMNMRTAADEHKAAVACGHWPLYRFDPRRTAQGLNPLQLDSKAPTISFKDYAYNETRYRMLTASKPDEAARLIELAQQDVTSRWRFYEQMAAMQYGPEAPPPPAGGRNNGV
jgi:pyruvate-ferredoxin/flavodoxin oxidoreductase